MNSIEQLADIVAELADEFDNVQDGRDGVDGKDGRDGLPGVPGRDGRDGRDGPAGPRGADGVGLRGPVGANGSDGRDGYDGLPGDIGPMPKHEWRGYDIRFEEMPGVWGDWVNVQGPRGYTGQNARVSGSFGSTQSLVIDGGGVFDETTSLDGLHPINDYTGIPGVDGGGPGSINPALGFNGGRP